MLTELLAQSRVAAAASGAAVETVVARCGVRALLLREPAVPFLSLALHIAGGAAVDPPDRLGLAFMAAGLLDEGAGPYDSQAFRGELEDHAIRLQLEADRDGISGELRTLTATREHAFTLLRLALTEPRFDAEPVERVRGQILADLRRRESDPDYLASRAWFAAAFPGHPYGRPTRGDAASIAAIGADDCRAFAASRLVRDQLLVGVAGDITAEELVPLLDAAFGDLPASAPLPEVPPVSPRVGAVDVLRLAIPQSVVVFGHGGLQRHDPDYYAGYVANYILGGGGFSSRLLEEVREKRGLAYSAYSYLHELDKASLWLGGVATNNQQVAQSLAIIRAELARMARGDLDETDLADARTYLTGSFPLRLTSNDQVAKMLAAMLVHDLGHDYLERRNALIEAVTLDDLRRVAQRLFAGELLVSVVGDPAGL